VNASELLQQAKEIFPETVVARDGFEIDVPFAPEA
jgi:ribonuclease BN (tRNA processing enzyme)